MKVLFILLSLAMVSVNAYAVGGTIGVDQGVSICTLSDGNYCYNSAELRPVGTSLCDSWGPGAACSKGLTTGKISKKLTLKAQTLNKKLAK